MRGIDEPLGVVAVEWFAPEDGGRQSGLPTAEIYASTFVAVRAGEVELQAQEMFSILMKEIGPAPDGRRLEFDFLVPDLTRQFAEVGSILMICEGPSRVVARAEVVSPSAGAV